MSSDPLEGLFDREELLAGLPAKRANGLVFLIESRTAHLVARSRQAVERFLTEESVQERELAFVEAFALGRDPPLRPTIQDLERHASEWASLVPSNARVQAAVAHRLGQKYEFTREAVPGIRAALGLDEAEVGDAYERLYREPLGSIFATEPALLDRLRWAWTGLAARLESLPPFWTAYSLTLTETAGATILALPIALAAVGPLAGVAVLAVLGLVNVLTVAFMAEAIARSGTIRYGNAFLGRVVADYLGRGGSLVLTVSLSVFCVLVLLVFYIGFSGTLEDATRIPAAAWVALLFLVGIYYLRRQSLNATIASALVVGAINIGLIVVLSVLAFGHARSDNLLYEDVPFVGGRPFESSIVALVFGVVLAAYFGHTSVVICGRLVLRRDPSARSLIWGCAAAQATAMFVYCLFVLAVNGAVAPDVLADEAGTALAPLAREIGPVVHVFGSAFVVLGLGMGSITLALALFSLARERLPSASPLVVALPRRQARLFFEERGGRSRRRDAVHLGLVYLGLDGGEPRFRLDVERAGSTHRLETTAAGRWELLGASGASTLRERFPDLRDRGAEAALEIVAADEQGARVRVTSTMRLAYEGTWDVAGLTLSDVLMLSDSEAELVGWMMRRGEASLADVAERIERDADATRAVLASLVDRGLVGEMTVAGEARYTPRPAPRRGARLSPEVWQALGAPERTGAAAPVVEPSLGRAPRLRDIVLGRRGRFALAAAPVLGAFLVAEWMVLTGSGSFAGLLNFVGTITVSLLAGVFPVFLLVTSRRKGDYVPAAVYRLLGNRVLLSGIYLLFLASVFLHGLVIWDNPIERGGALLAGAGIVVMTVVMARRGTFAPRVNVELRDDEGEGRARFAVTAAGRPATSDVRLEYAEGEERLRASEGEVPAFSSLRRVVFDARLEDAAADASRELKVWVHRITSEQDSEGLPARLDIHVGGETRHFDLELSRGQVVVPVSDGACRVDITLEKAH